MHILALSDEEVPALYHRKTLAQWEPDLLLGCGDLPYTYLESILTQSRASHAFFVHGNHDEPQQLCDESLLTTPGGWQNLNGRVAYLPQYDLLIAGLEGCIRYRPRGAYQYTEEQMRRRACKLWGQMLYRRVRHGRYVDIFIAHSPPLGIHNGPDPAHRGFEVFLQLLRRARPRLFLHGHYHRYGLDPWLTRYAQTEVVNVYPYRVIQYNWPEVGYLPRPRSQDRVFRGTKH